MAKSPWKKLLSIVATKGSASIYRTGFDTDGKPLFIILDARGSRVAQEGTAEQIAQSLSDEESSDLELDVLYIGGSYNSPGI